MTTKIFSPPEQFVHAPFPFEEQFSEAHEFDFGYFLTVSDRHSLVLGTLLPGLSPSNQSTAQIQRSFLLRAMMGA
jgi:hypothetical protein